MTAVLEHAAPVVDVAAPPTVPPAAGRRLLVGVVAGVGAVALLASVLLAALGGSTADATTTLSAATRAVEVTLTDGTVLSARPGTELPRGAVVRTGSDSSATLVTRGREVLVGAQSAVTVLDGARQRLDRGLVLVDATRGPGVTVDGDAADVSVADRSLTRIERGPAALRVAVLTGDTGVRSAGRAGSRTVPRLFQVQVPYGGLSGATTPLVLTGDVWERRYALALVQDDQDLRSLAAGLDQPGRAGAAVTSALPSSLAGIAEPTAAPQGERLLSYLVAQSARGGGSDLAARFTTVRGYRQDGGSWGVVAALVDGGASQASGALDAVLGGEAPVGGLTGDGPVAPGVVVGGTTAPPPAPAPTRPGTSPAPRPVPRPSTSPTVTPTTAPPPPPADLVGDLVDTVLDLLPSPAAPVPGGAPRSPGVVPGLLGTVGTTVGTVVGG